MAALASCVGVFKSICPGLGFSAILVVPMTTMHQAFVLGVADQTIPPVEAALSGF